MAQGSAISDMQALTIIVGSPVALGYIWWLVVKTLRLRYRCNWLAAHFLGCAAGVVMTIIVWVLAFVWNPAALLVGCILAGGVLFVRQELSAFRSALLPEVKPAVKLAPDMRWIDRMKKRRGSPAQKLSTYQVVIVSSGDIIAFGYIDADGDYSYRRVVARRCNERTINGVCLDRKQTRTFRVDRVVGEVTSESTGEVFPPQAMRMD